MSSILPHWDSEVDYSLVVIVFIKACQVWAFCSMHTSSLSLLSAVFLSLIVSLSLSLHLPLCTQAGSYQIIHQLFLKHSKL